MFGTIWDPEVVSCVIIDHYKVFRFLSPLLPQNSDCYWIPSPRAEALVFHQDPLKLFESIHEISEQLRSKVSESCKDVASKLTEADVDFFPMMAQNWFIDIFLHILPIDAAVRLWDRIILDKMPEVPVKFALNLLLLSKNDILICSPEDLNDVVADLPKRIQTPADVDWLLDSSDSSKVDAVTVNLIEKVENLRSHTLCGATQVFKEALATLEIPDRCHGHPMAFDACDAGSSPGWSYSPSSPAHGGSSPGKSGGIEWGLAHLANVKLTSSSWE